MNTPLRMLAALALLTIACDAKKGGAGTAASASASAMVTPSNAPSVTASAVPSASAPTEVASAAPSASSASSGTSMITGDAKDVVVTVKDPTKEPGKTIKAQAGGSVTLFLPDYPGTAWSVGESDKTLGKAKEEVIPGFAPGTNGHQFKWPTNGPLLKAGQKHKVQLVNKKAGDKTAKPSGTFALTIELT